MKISGRGFLALPQTSVLLIIVANVVEFLLCVRSSGSPAPTTNVLVSNGAITATTLATHEYWRLVAYGFLHVDPTHLAMNMLSLIIMGPFLERRLGVAYFLLTYFGALIAAALVSILVHKGAFVSAGASGAIYGILGALIALWVLGKSELSAGFFLMNLTLNFAFSASSSRIDWAAHAGGFVMGLASCAFLDLVEKINAVFMRCKFPEFAKSNTLFFVGAVGVCLYLEPPEVLSDYDPRFVAALWLLLAACIAKATDLMLSLKHGLAGVVIVLSLEDAALAYAICKASVPVLQSTCKQSWQIGLFDLDLLHQAICPRLNLAPIAFAVLTAAVLLTALWSQFARGITDKGFLAPTFRAERRRRHGI